MAQGVAKTGQIVALCGRGDRACGVVRFSGRHSEGTDCLHLTRSLCGLDDVVDLHEAAVREHGSDLGVDVLPARAIAGAREGLHDPVDAAVVAGAGDGEDVPGEGRVCHAGHQAQVPRRRPRGRHRGRWELLLSGRCREGDSPRWGARNRLFPWSGTPCSRARNRLFPWCKTPCSQARNKLFPPCGNNLFRDGGNNLFPDGGNRSR